jgi:hypothetical protein
MKRVQRSVVRDLTGAQGHYKATYKAPLHAELLTPPPASKTAARTPKACLDRVPGEHDDLGSGEVLLVLGSKTVAGG